MTLTSDLAARLERAKPLDGVADTANRVVTAVMPKGKLRSAVAGTWLGHPAHPFLVSVPVGCWTGASVLDILGQDAAADALIGAGLLAVPAVAFTGASDWVDTAGAERRVGLAHAVTMVAATGAYAASWVARRRGKRAVGVALAVGGAGVASIGGWLGGHLAYGLGVGVDTNAFDAGPRDWTPLDVSADEVGDEPVGVKVGHVALVLARCEGRICALADRCSHRGGPLSRGSYDGVAIECPWHASRFDLATGAVVAGPAVVDQPCYEVRTDGDKVLVRRREPRALRTNTV